ncbi:hypothetical protein A2291_06930 [candidate division WOR-1 bacterium RIFOXYB2_FULL_42_35]|uniref:Response regulatory domain-containing protein n=1 Tax=candidate division WOR-1 bacterium RIFOXYC2_FULL_41_25 TaxID=1802586 RepID=A0A1F4TPP5_UNCSA|nr:MAG: hypothetical protein A2291_06930 [candidate division WOR-1 bacterium RIFOXYB2_FULL_42_35]OGC24612.1 MAG: hypothetical protein A2247_06710 [candidate division WOR-1 bacterium RIFOXYA2_FULL_41_14]OGC34658.1 MAG: hypothetical protein A2462_04945 [candidate division WOR-1 bacterium RIFOXYC2_FULL_41_25]OGC41607.1 MAG: hypothetical protein A2548_01265 [candidate division WOR-1 bacterium RIFOXYD2_FULL_41_8]
MNKKRILVVDDEPDQVEMIKMLLEINNYEVLAAYDGGQALAKARSEKPDLIILDLMLPVMEGFDVCRLLKFDSKYSSIPIILFTAKASEEDRKAGEEVGADAYINKPFDPDVLLEKIKTLLK